MMDTRKEIRGELCRICGWDHASFDYTIDTATNRVTYTIDALVTGERHVAAFPDYAQACAAFEAIGQKIDARRRAFDAAPVLQATLEFKDGSHRRVPVSKPDNISWAPYIGEAFYKALLEQGVTGTHEDWAINVLDRRKRVVAQIPIAKRPEI